jgi:hypothetical protein
MAMLGGAIGASWWPFFLGRKKVEGPTSGKEREKWGTRGVGLLLGAKTNSTTKDTKLHEGSIEI